MSIQFDNDEYDVGDRGSAIDCPQCENKVSATNFEYAMGVCFTCAAKNALFDKVCVEIEDLQADLSDDELIEIELACR